MDSLELLRKLLEEKTCFAGIGNHLRGDDGFGPYLIEKMKERAILPEERLLAVEDVPENFAFPISHLDVSNVIFVDAIILDAPPGTVVFGPLEELEQVGEIASTHKLSLRLTARVIEETGKKVYLLGMVPESIEFGRSLSPSIRQAADELISLLEELIGGQTAPADEKKKIRQKGRESE